MNTTQPTGVPMPILSQVVLQRAEHGMEVNERTRKAMAEVADTDRQIEEALKECEGQ